MTTQYGIEGNVIEKRSYSVEQVGRVSVLLPTLISYQPLEMGRVPIPMTYIMVKPEGEQYVEARILVTNPPQVRNIVFNESGGDRAERQGYRIAGRIQNDLNSEPT